MSGQIKIKLTLFLPYDYDKEEEMINHMSRNGWQLTKGGLFHHTYHKDDQIYRYKLDYNSRTKYNSEEQQRYLSIFSEQGWEELSTTINGWHYFRKKYDPQLPEEDYELYTDDTSLLEMLGRCGRLLRGVQIMFFSFLIMNAALFIAAKDRAAFVNIIIEILGICFIQLSICNMKKKRVCTNCTSTLSGYAGYLLFGIFLIINILFLCAMFFGNY